MIRINLLPFRLARKKETIRRQVSIYFLTVGLILIGLYYWTSQIDKRIAQKRNEIAGIKSQITLYKEKADKVGEIKKKLKILDNKLHIVESLKKKRKEQVVLLEELPEKIVPERMWIETLRSDAGSVAMTGIAFDNPTIADFMKRLESSSLFSSVDLKRSSTRGFDKGVSLKAFELVCKKKQTAPPPDPKKKKGRKGK